MNHIIMDRPLCLIYSAAMVMDVSVEVLSRQIGHDGMEEWWPHIEDDRKHRSHTMQEMIDFATPLGHTFTPIESFPAQAPQGWEFQAKPTFDDHESRFLKHISGKKAVLIGQTENGNGHAWAWDGTNVLDPRGGSPDINELSIQCAWLYLHID